MYRSESRAYLSAWEDISGIQKACLVIGLLAVGILVVDGCPWRQTGQTGVSVPQVVTDSAPPVSAAVPGEGIAERTDEPSPAPVRWYAFTVVQPTPMRLDAHEQAELACWMPTGKTIDVRSYHDGWLEVWFEAGTERERLAGYIHEDDLVPPK